MHITVDTIIGDIPAAGDRCRSVFQGSGHALH